MTNKKESILFMRDNKEPHLVYLGKKEDGVEKLEALMKKHLVNAKVELSYNGVHISLKKGNNNIDKILIDNGYNIEENID